MRIILHKQKNTISKGDFLSGEFENATKNEHLICPGK